MYIKRTTRNITIIGYERGIYKWVCHEDVTYQYLLFVNIQIRIIILQITKHTIDMCPPKFLGKVKLTV